MVIHIHTKTGALQRMHLVINVTKSAILRIVVEPKVNREQILKQSTTGARPSKRTVVCELDFDDNDVSSDAEVSECSDTSSEFVWVLNFQQFGNETQETNVITEPEIIEISPNSSTRPAPGLSVPRVGKRPMVSNVNSFSKTKQPIVKIKIHNVNLQVQA